MWPTSDRFTEILVAGQRTWASRVEVLYGGERVAALDVMVDGSVSLDDVAVRRALDITLVDPHGDLTPASARDLLAPKGTEIRCWRGLLVDGEYEWVPLGVFGIQEPQVSAHQNGTLIKIRGADRVDAVRLRRFASPYAVARDTPTHEAIADIVSSRLPGVAMRITASGHTTPELVFDRLSDPWDAVRDLAAADSLAAYFDQLGTLIVTPALEQETGVTYEPGESSLLIDSAKSMDSASVYSGVVVTAEHPEQAPIVHELWDLDPKSVTYADGPFGRRPYGFSSPIITTLAQAELAAQTLLPKVSKMRAKATLTTVGHPGHDIGDIVTVLDPETRMAGRWTVVGGSVTVRPGRVVLDLEEVL